MDQLRGASNGSDHGKRAGVMRFLRVALVSYCCCKILGGPGYPKMVVVLLCYVGEMCLLLTSGYSIPVKNGDSL